MLRRPCTAIKLTAEDIAEYDKRRAQVARAAESEAANNLTQESTLDSQSQSAASQSWKSAVIQQSSFATPQTQLHAQRNDNEPVDESMTVDTDDDDTTAAPRRPIPQASVFTPPNAPIREPPEQRRQRTRAARIGLGG